MTGAAPTVGAFPEVPVIEHIHQAVLAAAKVDGAFDMGSWHGRTDAGPACETTHCRAGTVVHLAGAPGYALEKRTSTLFAAMQIYRASSPNLPVSPPRFFESNDVAMADMERCAREEASGGDGVSP